MTDPIEVARRRIFAAAALQTHAEWTTIVRTFYDRLLSHHPRLASHFQNTDIAAQVQSLAALLRMIATDLPDHDSLDRLLFQTGCSHVARGIGQVEFAEFIALLAQVLADAVSSTERPAAQEAWYLQLLIVANAMLLTAPN